MRVTPILGIIVIVAALGVVTLLVSNAISAMPPIPSPTAVTTDPCTAKGLFPVPDHPGICRQF